MDTISLLTNCRICKSAHLQNVIALGEQYITSRFPVYGDFSTPKTSITLCMCKDCGLIQLSETTQPEELYEYEYGYRSGISNTMRAHLKEYQEEILSKVDLLPGDTIIDIGSNDSTMLQYYSKEIRRIGVDPTGKQFHQYYGDVQLLPTYFTYENVILKYGASFHCKLVSSISMFYDLPDPVQFAKDIYSILEEDGIWTCEQSYLLTMLRTNSIDTICHEHLEYYSLHQIKEIADRAGFKIIDVRFNDCNGGSFRIYFAKRESQRYEEAVELISRILKEEDEYGIMNPSIYTEFMNRCNTEVSRLTNFIHTIQQNGRQMYVYGASTKGNCLLQYAGLGETSMKYAVERNPKKVGKMTSTGIPIISEETMRETPPEYLLVLPWHFRNEIVERERAFLEGGGQLVFPFPHFEIVGAKPKLLITGCDGMIAHYVKEQFAGDYNMYGIGRTFVNIEPSIVHFCADMTDSKKVEDILSAVRPDVIVHLAAISSSQYAYNHPIETIQINGLVTAQLCDMIHRNGWNTRLFNASSSEIYKGHVDYEVQEDDPNRFHIHPYSIAKTLGHSVVDFYRKQYGLPFSNGVIFTTESRLKRGEFLLNKVARHIREWIANPGTPLILGNLDSYRSILHASDVAKAIQIIVSQESGGSYLICHPESHQVKDLVIHMYSLFNIHLEKRDNIYVDKDSNMPVFIVKDSYTGWDSVVTNIRGNGQKLRELGWSPQVSIKDILNEIIYIE